MLLLPINRGGGRNLSASRSSRQQPRPHGNPVLREPVAMDTLPRVPACQPPSPRAAPRVCSHMRESWGREGWASRQLGPCPQACPGRGQGPRGCASAGEVPGLCLAPSANGPSAQASGRECQLPPLSQARDRGRKPGQAPCKQAPSGLNPALFPQPPTPGCVAPPFQAWVPSLPKQRSQQRSRVLPGKQYKSGCSHSRVS